MTVRSRLYASMWAQISFWTISGVLQRSMSILIIDLIERMSTSPCHITTGVVEGACRHLVKDRMERAGMHWTVAGAQAMLDLRIIHVSGLWDEYQQYRIAGVLERLYPHRALVERDFAMAA
jgi:hypothetical protein